MSYYKYQNDMVETEAEYENELNQKFSKVVVD